jgi:glycosyltransferase involved in cell wall biosynthesis
MTADNSWSIIEQFAAENPNVKGIRFMKNFGKSQALHAGFAKAKVKSSSQWMLIYKIVLKKFQAYTI